MIESVVGVSSAFEFKGRDQYFECVQSSFAFRARSSSWPLDTTSVTYENVMGEKETQVTVQPKLEEPGMSYATNDDYISTP